MTNGTGTLNLLPLAHQGGWDELLVVLAPLLVLVGLLVLATRRVNARLDSQTADESAADADGDERRVTSPEIPSEDPSGP